ncbi:MAG: hypothetical protein QOH13_1169, partial [Thermoleophilaceae bacterium]|nr:hypothetical protein [Thermoleophilaceae bacterium]
MITVAVCVAAGAEPAAETIDALGGRAVVVRADTVWQARRRALAECDSEVLAFVDGDVVVAPGWIESLEAAWAEAPQEIAAIGGPVRMRGVAHAHGSAARTPDAVASLVDLGSEALDLDPLERTLLAGNLSFRVAPLRGAGGFAPTVDRGDARDWFAEEHEAQRQLGHWGWLVRYDPAPAAERLPDWPGRPRGRRFRHGLRLGIARGRSAAVAARALAPALAGAIVARLRRKAELAQ